MSHTHHLTILPENHTSQIIVINVTHPSSHHSPWKSHISNNRHKCHQNLSHPPSHFHHQTTNTYHCPNSLVSACLSYGWSWFVPGSCQQLQRMKSSLHYLQTQHHTTTTQIKQIVPKHSDFLFPNSTMKFPWTTWPVCVWQNSQPIRAQYLLEYCF